MSRKELDRFLSDFEHDPELAREFRRLAADLDAAVRWANGRGYDFTREEAEVVDRAGELSDDDLELAAGGWTDPPGGGTPPPTGG
jgi:predicted ribosomally synthesized peptide with nif11-like leader